MSTHESSSVEATAAAGRPADLTPVVLDASCLESIALSHLRDLKAGLAGEGYLPAELTVEARFSDDAPFAVQSESDRLREYVRTVAFLGVGRVAVDIAEYCRLDDAGSTLAALGERARREDVVFELRGSIDGWWQPRPRRRRSWWWSPA